MMDGERLEPDVVKMPGARLLLVVSPYYASIAEQLVRGAMAAARLAEARVERVDVPGAFEIPAGIVMAAATRAFDAYAALGCVIRGETSHYDHVCSESARALMDLTFRDRLIIGNSILTVNTLAQAESRADPERGDKGGEAVRVCMAMMGVRRRLRGALG